MSTRSEMLVYSEGEEVARFYRHSDGYIEGHGLQTVLAMAEAELEDPNYWKSPFWAQHFMHAYTGLYHDIEIEPANKFCHGDLEWVYKVSWEHGGEPTLSIYDIPWDIELYADYSGLPEPMFMGTWREAARFVNDYWRGELNQDGNAFGESYDTSKWFLKGVSPAAWKAAMTAGGGLGA